MLVNLVEGGGVLVEFYKASLKRAWQSAFSSVKSCFTVGNYLLIQDIFKSIKPSLNLVLYVLHYPLKVLKIR